MTLNLDEIEARANAATGLPWDLQKSMDARPWYITGANSKKSGFVREICDFHIYGYAEEHKWMISENKKNGVFIAHARTDIPNLIQAVRERDEIIKAAIMHLRKLRILTKELNMDSSFCDVDDWFIEYEDQIEKWGLK